jgi:hypothetical protein
MASTVSTAMPVAQPGWSMTAKTRRRARNWSLVRPVLRGKAFQR